MVFHQSPSPSFVAGSSSAFPASAVAAYGPSWNAGTPFKVAAGDLFSAFWAPWSICCLARATEGIIWSPPPLLERCGTGCEKEEKGGVSEGEKRYRAPIEFCNELSPPFALPFSRRPTSVWSKSTHEGRPGDFSQVTCRRITSSFHSSRRLHAD